MSCVVTCVAGSGDGLRIWPVWWPVLLAHVVASVNGLPGLQDWLYVVAPVAGPSSWPMWWPEFVAHVVARVPGPCGGLSSWPMWWPVLLAHLSGHAAGLDCSCIVGQCDDHVFQPGWWPFCQLMVQLSY